MVKGPAPAELGVGIIGAGNIARVHALAIAAMAGTSPAGLSGAGGVKLRAILGATLPRAAALAKEFGAEATTNADAFFARSDIHIVSICTPSGTHAELGRRAAAAGKHVIVEKPIDVSLTAARALVAACQESGVRLGVVLQNRFLPAVALIKRAIDRGRLGRLHLVDAYVKWHRSASYYESARWRGTHALDGGGALINQGIHTADLAQYFAGDAATVIGYTARKRHQMIEGEDTALALVTYRSGAAGVIEATTSVVPGFARRVEVHGERGSVILDGNDISVWHVEGHGEEEAELEQLRTQARDSSDGASNPLQLEVGAHQRQFEDFVGAVREGRQPAVDGHEGARSLGLVLAVYESARTGEKVELPDNS
jgi:UDP-N-acetyl-2-amino-2-deoxyglucuronate dehydrogenase